MKRNVCIVLIISILLAGCMGRSGHPVAVRMPGDESMSCEALDEELTKLENEIDDMLSKMDTIIEYNLICASLAFYIIPLFFINPMAAEGKELEAARERHNLLVINAMKKNCCWVEDNDHTIIRNLWRRNHATEIFEPEEFITPYGEYKLEKERTEHSTQEEFEDKPIQTPVRDTSEPYTI